MPANKQKSTKRRTQVKALPKKEKELSTEEQKNVKGGIIAILIGRSDTTKGITDGTSNTVSSDIKQ
jgi:hypothetical protein